MDLKGQTALVTGASSGIGVAFARQLAARGADLVITARRKENLESLAKELGDKHGIEVQVVALDLSEVGSPQKLWDATEGAGTKIDVLVNNAGGGIQQYFIDTSWEKLARQMQLNVLSLTELTHKFSRAMKKRGRGWIMNVSSIGAYTPTPSMATYSAGKAYVRDFTEALAFELAGTPVRVCCLCPGGTESEFHVTAGQTLSKTVRATFMSADDCAGVGLRALFGGRRNIVSGLVNALSVFFMRFTPRRLLIWATAKTLGPPKPSADPST
jgi:hypothetical protein